MQSLNIVELLLLQLYLSSAILVIGILVQLILYFRIFKHSNVSNIGKLVNILLSQIGIYFLGLLIWKYWPFNNLDIMASFINLPTLISELLLLPIFSVIYLRRIRKR